MKGTHHTRQFLDTLTNSYELTHCHRATTRHGPVELIVYQGHGCLKEIKSDCHIQCFVVQLLADLRLGAIMDNIGLYKAVFPGA